MKIRTNKLLHILIVIMILFMLVSCSDSEKTVISSSKDETQEKNEEKSSSSNEKETKAKATIEEQVLLDYDGIKITAKELSENWLGPEMKVLIENNTESDITVQVDDIVVNDYMMSTFLYETVSAGKKSNTTFSVYNTMLKDAGIENVGKIEIYFSIVDPSSFKTIYESDVVEIHTSMYDSMDTTTNEMGEELINENGIRIVGKYVEEGSVWGNGVVLYIENNTERTILVSADDLSINGFMITGYLYEKIKPGKKAISSMILSSTDLEENDIDKIEEIATKFIVYDYDSFRPLLETKEIGFSIQ